MDEKRACFLRRQNHPAGAPAAATLHPPGCRGCGGVGPRKPQGPEPWVCPGLRAQMPALASPERRTAARGSLHSSATRSRTPSPSPRARQLLPHLPPGHSPCSGTVPALPAKWLFLTVLLQQAVGRFILRWEFIYQPPPCR